MWSNERGNGRVVPATLTLLVVTALFGTPDVVRADTIHEAAVGSHEEGTP